jgi:hypothetical protein
MSLQEQIAAAQCCPAAEPGGEGHSLLDVVGIDIGTINLALCRLRWVQGQPVVVWWQLIDLLGLERGIARDACAALPRCLAPYLPCFADCQFFAIEQQPHTNPTMCKVSHALIAYFHTINPECETYISSASNKLRPFAEAQTDTYDQRKASAQAIVGRLLNETIKANIEPERHIQFGRWFAALKKRDDAADAYLHAYYSLRQRQLPRRIKAKTTGSLNAKQLQEELRERGLPVSGKKQELRERLRTAKAGESGKTKLSVKQLREELTARGLEATGTKVELAKRLYAAQSTRRPARTKPAAETFTV